MKKLENNGKNLLKNIKNILKQILKNGMKKKN